MAENATDLKEVTDDQLETQVQDLTKKEDKSDDDNTQLETLKTERQTRYQKRIDKLTGKSKYAEEQLEVERVKNEKLVQDLADAKAAQPIKPMTPIEESVTIDGQAHYTDAALRQMIESKQITDDKAYELQRARDKAQLKSEILEETTAGDKKAQEEKVRADDKERVLTEYPQFDSRHKDFNPKDDLYQLANEIYSNGYAAKPDGLSRAINLAKRTLGITNKTPDISDALGIQGSSEFGQQQEKEKEITFTDQQKDDAYQVWRNVKNPATQRNYTFDEAVEKAKKAKLGRRR